MILKGFIELCTAVGAGEVFCMKTSLAHALEAQHIKKKINSALANETDIPAACGAEPQLLIFKYLAILIPINLKNDLLKNSYV